MPAKKTTDQRKGKVVQMKPDDKETKETPPEPKPKPPESEPEPPPAEEPEEPEQAQRYDACPPVPLQGKCPKCGWSVDDPDPEVRSRAHPTY
jgi:hypothetical protein